MTMVSFKFRKLLQLVSPLGPIGQIAGTMPIRRIVYASFDSAAHLSW